MKTLITGHRLHKLECYDKEWIKSAIFEAMEHTFLKSTSYGLAGMASGADLWFCEACFCFNIPFAACVPFESQAETMDNDSKKLRAWCLRNAAETKRIRNSLMVDKTDAGLVVFDGNKGGTHNVFQQLIEKQKPFVWINPVAKKIWELQ